MRKQAKTHRLLRTALAVVLACGMTVPATGVAAWADEEMEPTPPLAEIVDSAEGDANFDDAVGEKPAEESVPAGDAAEEPAPDQGAPENEAASDDAAEKPENVVHAVVAHVASTVAAYDATAVPAAAEAEAAPASESGAAPLAVETVTKSGYTFTGEGIGDGDFTLSGTTQLAINTSTPVTVSGGSTSVGLLVPAGQTANLVLDGVTTSAAIAFDIKATGVANIVLADNKTNSFTSTSADFPGIHCGTGATLTIDDSVANVDASGNLITPVKGRIPAGTVYTDKTGATRTSTGDPLINLDSATPGTLNVKGGGLGAGLGGARGEDGGSMTFNGGTIVVNNGSGPTNSGGNCAGAGIGGGQNAAGTSPTEWITINGGRITANAAFHGAGIGGGWNTGDAAVASATPALTLSKHPAGTGNIRINGGFILSNGGNDGNGFGRGCYGNRKYCDNRDYTILITGGTMIPKGGTNLGEWGMDLGGSGTQTSSSGYTDPTLAAHVCISGGSVYVGVRNASAGTYRFDGIAYGSFTENADGTISINETSQVVPITIDLTADLTALTPEGQTVDTNRTITSWDILVGGEQADYGAPAQFDNGKLYLWLSPEQAAQQVEVRLTYAGNDGKPVPVEPLYRPAGSTNGDTNLKRYVFFDLQEDFFDQQGGETGEATVSYDSLSSYEQKKYKDLVDENGNVKVPVLKKAYDGLPYHVRELTGEDNSINSGGDDNKPIWEDISYLGQLYDAKTGTLGVEHPSDTMPTDTGLTRFTMTSTQYSDHDDYKTSYYGHRAYGWCEITPVPAVVKISDHDGTAWVRLAEDGSSYELVQKEDTEPGNRLRVAFDIRSARGTATTCKAPTGKFQVMIDGQPVGDPIELTEEAIEKSIGSTYEVVKGEEDRETVRVVYYLDPTRLDGALDVLETAGQGNEHEVTVQYQPDKNYVEGTEANPENEASKPTTIVPVKPEGDVTPDGPVKIEETDDPDDPDNPDDSDDTPDHITVVRRTITASYGDFHKKDQELEDSFKLKIDSASSMKLSFNVSNPAVADIIPNADGSLSLDADGKLPVRVNSCGTSVITVEQKGNALYTGSKYILTVVVLPDPSIKPQVQIRLTSRNLTALAELAGTQVAQAAAATIPGAEDAVAFAARATADRTSLPPRPGDVMEYTVTGLNLTPGSSWQAAELKDAIDQNLNFDSDSVELAANYPTHSTEYTKGTSEFYRGFNWDGLGWQDVKTGDYTFSAQTLSKAIGSVYGGQSTSVRFQATVAEGTGNRPSDKDPEPVIKNDPTGSGGYGKNEEDLAPGEKPVPPTDLVPGADIFVIGDGGTEPDDPTKPVDADPIPDTPVIPKDPAAGDIVTEVDVELIGTEVTHEPDRVLVGDTLKVTATSTNTKPDTKLVDGVIKVTLPKGAELKPGTIKLTDAEGNTYDVPDSAYDPKTGTVAVNAGDLYGGESAELTFEVEVTSTKDTRPPDDGNGDGEDGDDPDNPGDPDDPSNPGGGSGRPDDFPIKGSTQGGTPTDEWDKTHPDGPDNGDDPYDKPKPGTPHVPTPGEEDAVITGPDGTDPDAAPVLPKDPVTDGDDPDIKVTKTAENTSREEEETHVGDVIRYRVTLSNSGEHSMWYDAVFVDTLPKGIEPVAGTIRVTGPDGVEREVPDDAYDPQTRILSAHAGDVAGGRFSVLVFDALVTEDAIGADIGNTATAYGTKPSEADPGAVSGGSAARPTPGAPFTPDKGWDGFFRENQGSGVSNADAAYPAGTDAKGGVLAAVDGDGPGTADGSGAGAGNGDGKKTIASKHKLAKTGDENGTALASLGIMAAGALVLLVVALRRNRGQVAHRRIR